MLITTDKGILLNFLPYISEKFFSRYIHYSGNSCIEDDGNKNIKKINKSVINYSLSECYIGMSINKIV